MIFVYRLCNPEKKEGSRDTQSLLSIYKTDLQTQKEDLSGRSSLQQGEKV